MSRLVGVLVLLLALTSPALGAEESWTRYVDQELGIRLSVPAGWQVTAAEPLLAQAIQSTQQRGTETDTNALQHAATRLILSEHPIGAPVPFNPNLTLAVQALPQVARDASPAKQGDIASDLLAAVDGLTRLTPIERLTVDGLVGVAAEYAVAQPAGPQQMMSLRVRVTALIDAQHGRAFLLTATAPAAEFARYAPLFQRCLDEVALVTQPQELSHR